MNDRKRITCVVLVALLLTGCDGRADAASGAGADLAGNAAGGSAGNRATTGAEEFPCSLFTLSEMGALLGASELRATPLDNTCSWLNPQRQGVEMYVNTAVDLGMLGAVCDGSVPRTLDECGFAGEEYESASGIGREARVWREQPYFDIDTPGPARWAAEALSGNDVITVYVNESFGRDVALRVLRAAVEKMAGRS
jgi:hypothetical protein